MASSFKILIIGGGIAGLSLAIMLEKYGLEYELLEKHADVAPKLGAGVGLTPNGARILDQIGVWDEMCRHASPVDSGTALSPQGRTVIFNPHMGEWLEQLFGYKIHFLSRHDCLRILFEKIQRRSSIHLLQEVTDVSFDATSRKTNVTTKNGSVYSGDIVIGADGVRSNMRRRLWELADAEQPGYIPQADKTGIKSFYTAVIGIALNPPLPEGGSARAYNHQRSYFFQEARKGSGEFYWWLCAKNEETKSGILPKLSNDVKQDLLSRYADDRIGDTLTLGALAEQSVYSTAIPLQEFTLQKCFYRNIVLIGDTYKKLHPVAGQGANSAIEDSAMIADLLRGLRENNTLGDPKALEQGLLEFQTERFVRATALREDANLVQRMESLDNPGMRFMALYVVPRLPFVATFLPQLGSSFTPAKCLKYLPPPKAGMCPFSQDMKACIHPRSSLATAAWAVSFMSAALLPYIISQFVTSTNNDLSETEYTQLSHLAQLYLAVMAVPVSAMWVIESYKASSLISPFTSALLWIVASNHWGWDTTLPLYCSLNVFSSKPIGFYHMPQTMTDLGAAKLLLPATLLSYWIPVIHTQGQLGNISSNMEEWQLAHCALPVVVFLGSMVLGTVSNMPKGVDVVFTNIDLPWQQRSQKTIVGITSIMHISLYLKYGSVILNEGVDAITLPVVRSLISLSVVGMIWCFYMAWELRRINATSTAVVRAWGTILLGAILGGPAATLAATYSWWTKELAHATSHQHEKPSAMTKES
ncbi:hypothetical protein F4808DRAFT_468608 [Astrocystis sublimbata]|nr:hypothetical protein F4808DRAFT_468608 [Astrocystis sublimbata]